MFLASDIIICVRFVILHEYVRVLDTESTADATEYTDFH